MRQISNLNVLNFTKGIGRCISGTEGEQAADNYSVNNHAEQKQNKTKTITRKEKKTMHKESGKIISSVLSC